MKVDFTFALFGLRPSDPIVARLVTTLRSSFPQFRWHTISMPPQGFGSSPRVYIAGTTSEDELDEVRRVFTTAISDVDSAHKIDLSRVLLINST